MEGEIAARGYEEASKGNFRSAVDWFTSALDLNRCDFRSLANRSLCLYQMNRFEEAAADAHRAVQLRPLEAKGHYLLARSLLALKRFREADRAISQAARLLPPSDPMQQPEDLQMEVLRLQVLTAGAVAENQALDARTTVSSDSGHSSPSGDESYPASVASFMPSAKRHSSDLTNSHSFTGESAWSHFRPASRPLFSGDSSANFGFGMERDSVWSTSNNTTNEQSGGWPDFNATAFPGLGLRADPLLAFGQGFGSGGRNSRPGSGQDMHFHPMSSCMSSSGQMAAKSPDLARVQNILRFKSVFVDNVSPGVTMEQMMSVFSVYGPVVTMAVKPVLGNVATFACVEYADWESPENAVTDAMNNPIVREGLNFDLNHALSVKFTPSASERRALSSGCQARSWAQSVIERSGECFEWRFASSCSLGKNCVRKHIVRHRQIDTLKSFTL